MSPLRIDPDHSCVWIESQRIVLRPTPFAILCYLAEHTGQLVSKEDILQAVWLDTRVNSAVLKTYVQQLRKALGDDAKAPRFIETVQRRGYRFIGTVVSSRHSAASEEERNGRGLGAGFLSSQPSSLKPLASPLIGRETELGQLHSLFDKAINGERQFVFVTGEPGIGKSALLEAFMSGVRDQEKTQKAKIENSSLTPNPQPPTPGVWWGWGQCVEQYGAGEAYLPILDALGRLCRGPQGERCILLLHQYAPSWLLQLPWLLPDGGLDTLRQRTQGGTPARMLREFAEFIEALAGRAADAPTLVLLLEDLHWSDSATLDLLSFLARRWEPARLLVIGTYRPQEVTHITPTLLAITRELLTHSNCKELSLPLLNEHEVATYVTQQLSVPSGTPMSLPDTIRTIRERTEGNPLFMVSVVQHIRTLWLAEGSVTANTFASALSSVPSNLQQLIEKQFAQRSPEEQRLLESASVVGVEFSTATVAAGLAGDEVEVESRCSVLARHGLFLQARGIRTWPDGTVTGTYSFMHALYQQVLLAGLAPGWRAHLHRRIGERLESGFGGRASEIAAELALHFEQGQEFQRAIPYCMQAAQTAFGRFGYREAALLLDKGVDTLQHLPSTSERDQQEVMLLFMRVASCFVLEGYGSERLFRALTRIRELCERHGNTHLLSFAYSGLAAVTLIRGDLPSAHALGEQALVLAQQSSDSLALIWAHLDVGETSLFRGEIAKGHEHFLQGKTLGASMTFVPETSLMDPGIMCTVMLGWSFLALGYPNRALVTVCEALGRARHAGNPYTLVVTLVNAGAVYGMCADGNTTEQLAREALVIAHEHDMPFWEAWGTTLLGGAFAIQGRYQEGHRVGKEGIQAQSAAGCKSGHAGALAFVAECCARQGQVEAGLATLAEAEDAMRTTDEYFWEPRLLQIKGELLLGRPGTKSEVEAVLQHAIDLARAQGAKFTELQAVMSLCRLWRTQRKKDTARKLLADTYQWFTEGFDTVPLREAKTLLSALG